MANTLASELENKLLNKDELVLALNICACSTLLRHYKVHYKTVIDTLQIMHLPLQKPFVIFLSTLQSSEYMQTSISLKKHKESKRACTLTSILTHNLHRYGLLQCPNPK